MYLSLFSYQRLRRKVLKLFCKKGYVLINKSSRFSKQGSRQGISCSEPVDFFPFVSREGVREMVSLQKGLNVFHGHVALQQDIVVKAQYPWPVLEFGCLLSGTIEGDSITDDRQKYHWGGNGGHAWVSYCSRSQSTVTYFSGEPIHVVVFQLFAPLLDTLFLDTDALICTEQINNCLANASSVTPLLHQIIGYMRCKDFCLDELDRLYLTSKSCELLFHLRHSVIGKGRCPLLGTRARAVDRAVRMILEHLDTRLSLEQIAREAGVCATGLNAGFKEAFGTTVFGYIRQQRLSRARELIEHQDKTVSEAAWESGYQSLSSFHRAFYARYGVAPGTFSKKKS